MKYLLLILAVALLLFLDLRRLEYQIQGVEARMDAGPPWRGFEGPSGLLLDNSLPYYRGEWGPASELGRKGGFGSYSSYWTREHGWRTVFVPLDGGQP